MPRFSKNQLVEMANRVLTGAGVPARGAQIVANELAEANLVGHDSHGVIRLKQYVDYIGEGVIKPHGAIEQVVDTQAVSVFDGGGNFGQVVGKRALERALTKGAEAGAHSVFCRTTNPLGRLGSYTDAAARAGFAAVLAVNGPGKGGAVAPWGSAERRLGTNPISFASPAAAGADPLVLDMTTSVTAEGKVRVAFQKGVELPAGWLIDANGQPTTDPAKLYEGGAILPLGGPMGFKGYGLSVMMDIFCGVLSGSGVVRADLPPGTNGVWLSVYHLQSLLPRDEYDRWLSEYTQWIKSAKTTAGVDEILFPGEIEQRRRAERVAQGVDLPDGTWRQINEVAENVGADLTGVEQME
jgi:uncharacterized oxidoreductase